MHQLAANDPLHLKIIEIFYAIISIKFYFGVFLTLKTSPLATALGRQTS